jgi:hypothetical protein
MSDLTRDDYQRDLQALRGNVIDAWGAMKTAGFSIADDATPLDMVTHLLKRNQDQKTLEDGLRERLKAAEEGVAQVAMRPGPQCPFRIDSAGRCMARGNEAYCSRTESKGLFVDQKYFPPCALDEGPILVKKAEDESGSASGEAKAIQDDCPQDKKDRGGI